MFASKIMAPASSSESAPISRPLKHIIAADSIVVNKEIGVGEFGIVQQGIWTNDEGERVQVAIKCLSKQRIQSNSMEFLKEAAMMHSIDHEHIVRLYGVVLDTSTLMLVTELALLRSLLECLKEPALKPSFTVISLCDFSHQICDGMQYLESKRLIHRDLAARNILVFAKNRVKISDFGLSRALGVGKDYYQTNFNVNLKLPIAWCAPECINYLKFTSSSDVWAYGVTLWEMFSYGFQPWAALSGQQILEAIDEPNFQRLEQPECCPKEYYSLMLKCWEHDLNKRPKFSEITRMLPDCRPELVQAVKDSGDTNSSPAKIKKDFLQYKVGDVITVLDKKPDPSKSCSGLSSTPGSLSSFGSSLSDSCSLWKGVHSNGKTGVFNPSNTVTYLGQNLPASTSNFQNPTTSKSSSNFIRGIFDLKNGGNGLYSSKRRLRPEMISRPQTDLKHTGHVGADGAFFGDISFLGDKYHQLPKQVVAPYKPQDDKSERGSLTRNASDLSDKAPLIGKSSGTELRGGAVINHCLDLSGPSRDSRKKTAAKIVQGADHEYHEIGCDDDDFANLDSPPFETLDFGPSLLDEVFRELDIIKPDSDHDITDHQQSINDCNTNVKNEIKEMASKFASGKENGKKKQATVKPISATDQHNLDSAIAMAQELASRSMLELDGHPNSMGFFDNGPNSESPKTPTSPNKKKTFSFKFKTSPKAERRNFSKEAENIPDIQSIITEEAKEAYNSLIERRDSTDRSREPFSSDKRKTAPVSAVSAQIAANHGSQDSLDGDEDVDANPLRMLRSGLNVIPKVRGNKQRLATTPQTASLARLTASVNRSALGAPPPVPPSGDQNALPLPPRDRTKPLQVLKHHQRKHPLLMPDNQNGSQNGSAESLSADSSSNGVSQLSLSSFRPHVPVLKQVSCPEPPASYLSGLRKSVDASDLSSQKLAPLAPPKPTRSYLIEDSFESQIQAAIDNLDSFSSLNGHELSPQVTKEEVSVRDHHVSCEDLLDFAVDKPVDDNRNCNITKGPASDEVRVMQKVLANEVTLKAEECVEILNGTGWDVHKAIKCIRLRETLKAHSINLNCNWIEMLTKFNWNIRQASNYLIATHSLPEDTTEV